MANVRTMRNPKTGEVRQVAEGEDDLQLRNDGFVLEDSGSTGRESEDYESLTVDELKTRAAEAGVEVSRSDGESGSPLKSDYVRTLRRHDRKAAQNA